VESITLQTPRDPFSDPVDPAVFDEPQLPMRVLPIQDGFLWWVEGFNLFKLDPLRWIGAVLVFLILCATTLIVPLVGPILQHVLQTVLLGGLMLGCRRVEAGERFQIGSLFWAFEGRNFKSLAVMALVIILGFISFFLVIGISFGLFGLAFSISRVMTLTDPENLPAIVLMLLITTLAVSAVGMFYWFAPGLIVFHGVGPIDAMRLSFVASLKNMGPMLTFGVVFVLLLFVGIVTLGLGYLVIGPVAFVTLYTSTRAVFGVGAIERAAL
jgi:uncharacterized membrane protein